MNKFKRLNNIFGWSAFLISAVVYLLTIEPTTSLWDCGEFIANASRLEIGHPPGAPFYMLSGRLFAIFATDVSNVAMMLNSFSAIVSAFTILFLFWTITHFGRKILFKDGKYTTDRMIAVFGSGFIGALAFTFSDTFWFSAVEAEVYAHAAFLASITFWSILKWENEADKKRSNRWFVFIGFLLGIAFCVHLLGLLVIPPLAMIVYYKYYKPTSKGIITALGISFIVLVFIMYVFIPTLLKGAAYFDLLFVNTFNFPFHSGVLFFILLLTALIIWGIHYTHQHGHVILNTAILSITMLLIGYISYATIIIRSDADPPLDENNPESIFALISYLNREQYGQRPIFYGAYYNAPVIDVKKGKPKYAKYGDKYKIIDHGREYVYDDNFKTVFPRIYSSNHINEYKNWIDIEGKIIKTKAGEERKVPTFGENLKYFFKYQIGHMYVRYFMWNFAGRQNDNQGFGGPMDGNWITGIKFIDNKLVGPQDKLPNSIKNHPARNTYYLLPFILGILGLMYHLQKNKKDFSVVLFLFFMTGIAIILYLNQPPREPRERDYTYAQSFYAFSIWIGLGMLSVYEFLRQKLPKIISPVLAFILCFSLVPVIMAKENWDDHDRSNRYTARAHAYNYLNSCEPNAILFTNGDNDTFPLWYLQEVEGIRTDVRVVNLMLLNMDWHIIQAKRKAYNSDPLPITLTKDKYLGDKNAMIPLTDRIKRPVTLKQIMNFVNSNNPDSKIRTQGGKRLDYIPAKQFILPVDSSYIAKNNIVPPERHKDIVSEISWKINKNHISKSDLVVMDILAHNEWKRPIYFLSPGHGNSLGLKDYMQLEGYAYRLVPVRAESDGYSQIGEVYTQKLYDKLMNDFIWGNINHPDVYLDHYHRRSISVLRLRHKFHRLASALIEEGKNDSAIKVLDKCMELLPNEKVPYDFHILNIIEDYYALGKIEKANEIVKEFTNITGEEANYYIRVRKEYPKSLQREIQTSYHFLRKMESLTNQYNQKELNTLVRDELEELAMSIGMRGPQPQQNVKPKKPVPKLTQ